MLYASSDKIYSFGCCINSYVSLSKLLIDKIDDESSNTTEVIPRSADACTFKAEIRINANTKKKSDKYIFHI